MNSVQVDVRNSQFCTFQFIVLETESVLLTRFALIKILLDLEYCFLDLVILRDLDLDAVDSAYIFQRSSILI